MGAVVGLRGQFVALAFLLPEAIGDGGFEMRLPVATLVPLAGLSLLVPQHLGLDPSRGAVLGAVLALCLAAIDAYPIRRGPRPSFIRIIAAFAAGLTSLPLVSTIAAWSAVATGGPAPQLIVEARLPSPELVFVTVVLAPIFEEYIFRRRLLDALIPLCGRLPAVIASALVFSAFHVAPPLLAGTFLAGIVLALLRLSAQSLHVCIAYHIGLNVAALSAGAGAVPGSSVSVALIGISLLFLSASLQSEVTPQRFSSRFRHGRRGVSWRQLARASALVGGGDVESGSWRPRGD